MSAPDHAVEMVIQTATGLLTGRFGPREAVTILASQVPQARAAAPALAAATPDRARDYAELLRSIAAELAPRVETSEQKRDLREVLHELERVVAALTPEGSGRD